MELMKPANRCQHFRFSLFIRTYNPEGINDMRLVTSSVDQTSVYAGGLQM